MHWNDQLRKVVETRDRTRAETARQQATVASQLATFASQVVNPSIREFMAEMKSMGRRCELAKVERPAVLADAEVLHEGFALKIYHGKEVESHFGMLVAQDGELIGTAWMGEVDQTFALGHKFHEVKKADFQSWMVNLYQKGLGLGMTV